jgi:hypothetical protein
LIVSHCFPPCFSAKAFCIFALVEKIAHARPGPDSSLTGGARDRLFSGHSTSKIKAILFSRKNHWTRLLLPAERRLMIFVFRVKDSPLARY